MFRSIRSTVALSVLAVATTATAKTFTVSKDGNLTSIQAAISAASPGDTIKVESGTYRENVVVPSNRAGLTIDGSGKVFIDAYPASGNPAGPGIRVQAADVTLRDLIVKNAREAGSLTGDGVYVTAARVTIVDVKAWNCDDAGLHVVSSQAVIRDCFVRSCDEGIDAQGFGISVNDFKAERVDDGIVIEGNGARVTSCDIVQASSYGVEIDGNDGRVKDCYVLGTSSTAVDINGDDAVVVDCRTEATYHAIEVAGNRCLVKGNKIKRQYREAIEVTGSDAKVIGNTITDCGSYAITVEGSGATVSGNKVRKPDGYAIDVDGGAFTITGNDIRECTDGYAGISIDFAVGGLIADNDIRDNSGGGIEIGSQTYFLEIRDNEVKSCGDDGYYVAGTGHTVTANLASKCSRNGFRTYGSQHVLKGNEAVGGDGDGFDAEGGSQHEFRDNLAKGNGAEGFDIGSDSTLVKNNVAEKNRLDLTNSGANNTFDGNEFQTGGPTVAPQLD